MRKKKTFIVLALVIFIIILSICLKGYLLGNHKEVINSSCLNGKMIELDHSVNISFNNIENGSSLKTNFTIIPPNGVISIKYISGGWTSIKVDLYDKKTDECIQTGKIENIGKNIKFTNLNGASAYYIKFSDEENLGMDVNNLTLSFSE